MSQAKTLGRLATIDWNYNSQSQINQNERALDVDLVNKFSINKLHEIFSILPSIFYSATIIYYMVISSSSFVSAAIV